MTVDPSEPRAGTANPGPTARRIGVLLANLGTPRSADVADVRRYLREFLWDPDVVQIPRALWWPILNGFVIPFRARKSARLYERIWTPEGSPLLVNSSKQRERLAAELGPTFRVTLGMRYGTPSVEQAVGELVDAGCECIVACPLFPQYSHTTNGSVMREVRSRLELRSQAPELLTPAPWFDDPSYVSSVVTRIRDVARTARIDHYVLSFHGLPAAYTARGDPYREQCGATAHAVARGLELADEDWSLVFQSRLGSQEWLRPYADEFVPQLAARFKRVLVSTPGFVADCLETLEEIQLRLREQFIAAGGEDLVVVPALNDHPLWIRSLAGIVRRALETRANATSRIPREGELRRTADPARD